LLVDLAIRVPALAAETARLALSCSIVSINFLSDASF
jgi:hypothetical protein